MREIVGILVILGFVLIGFFFSSTLANLKGFVVPLLVLVMWSVGFSMREEDLMKVIKSPLLVTYGAFVHYTVMPLLAYVLSHLLKLDKDLYVGMILVGASPSGTASNVLTYMAGGNLPYAVGVTVFSTLLSPIMTPLWTYLLAGHVVEVDLLKLAKEALAVVVLPVVLGFSLRRTFPQLSKLESFFPVFSILVIGLIVGVVVAVSKDRILQVSVPLFVAVFLHNLMGLALGFFIGKLTGLDRYMARTLSIEVGTQNSGLAVALALSNFSPSSALPGAVFSVVQNVNGLLLAHIYRRWL
ncbi:Bile acid:sodium symporter [Thermocrinis albus DSM 14484]|uniref:Bile acid:sodium symporter n=1 Tax=Thermocrinis albus (strain DSM 14484 / JCM 11386 / HI 11/12) TaxID=638303 RepID=D3SPE5_THEAH|nr:bile acid:sodium symporter family protein [Thermocrinis albus]ADC89032.1 Bile acid:sodium symporter [Thermocrinis albus DSM 14484]